MLVSPSDMGGLLAQTSECTRHGAGNCFSGQHTALPHHTHSVGALLWEDLVEFTVWWKDSQEVRLAGPWYEGHELGLL